MTNPSFVQCGRCQSPFPPLTVHPDYQYLCAVCGPVVDRIEASDTLDTHAISRQIAAILETQSTLNASVARALQAVALTADHLESELAEIRSDVRALRISVGAVDERLDDHEIALASQGFSRKVM